VAVGLQSAHVVRGSARLKAANVPLSDANRSLAEEIKAREVLGENLQELRYLYRLRTALGEVRSPHKIVQASGEALMDILDRVGGGVEIELDGSAVHFGSEVRAGSIDHERDIA
tara:strand:+ start:144 stop:485 length:342 start_codon:yes stop_codon:yes gene_type:complete